LQLSQCGVATIAVGVATVDVSEGEKSEKCMILHHSVERERDR
jgi:hypothetical protein